MLWSKKVLESIRGAYGRNILVIFLILTTGMGDVFSIGTSNFAFEDQHGVLRCCKRKYNLLLMLIF